MLAFDLMAGASPQLLNLSSVTRHLQTKVLPSSHSPQPALNFRMTQYRGDRRQSKIKDRDKKAKSRLSPHLTWLRHWIRQLVDGDFGLVKLDSDPRPDQATATLTATHNASLALFKYFNLIRTS
jgi:hypothetical protein